MQSVKIIACIAFIAFVGVQFATSLKCYNCNSISSCKSPVTVICNGVYANQTTAELRKYYQSIPDKNTTNFDCVLTNLNSTAGGVEVRGCIYREIDTCGTNLISGYSKKTCLQCSGDLCNNPAAMPTPITFFTVLTSVIGLAIAKVVVH